MLEWIGVKEALDSLTWGGPSAPTGFFLGLVGASAPYSGRSRGKASGRLLYTQGGYAILTCNLSYCVVFVSLVFTSCSPR